MAIRDAIVNDIFSDVILAKHSSPAIDIQLSKSTRGHLLQAVNSSARAARGAPAAR
jgi:hypothetical protein